MKIGVIGLGNIAQKAYLPTYSECRHLAEFVLATRNPETRQEIADQYGFTETVGTIEELIEAKIDACFVHVATKCMVQSFANYCRSVFTSLWTNL